MALLDQAFIGSFNGSASSPYSLAGVAVANNANRALYITVALDNIARDVSSVTWNGQSATRIFDGSAAGDVRLQIWRIIAPAAGTAPVIVTATGSAGWVYATARSVYNTDQTTPNGAVLSSMSIAYPVSLSPTAASANDLVLDVWAVSAGGPITTFAPGSNQTQDFVSNAAYYRSIVGSHRAGAAGAATVTENQAQGALNYAVYAAFVVNDAGGGSGGGATVNLAAANSTQTNTSSTGTATETPAGQQTTATVTSKPLAPFGGVALASTTIPNVVLLKLDRSLALSLANQVTNGSGQLVITSSVLVAGTDYMLAMFNADGTQRGLEKVTAV